MKSKAKEMQWKLYKRSSIKHSSMSLRNLGTQSGIKVILTFRREVPVSLWVSSPAWPQGGDIGPEQFGCCWVETWGSTIYLFQKGTYNLGILRGREKEKETVLGSNFYKYIDMKYTKTSTMAQKISHCHLHRAVLSPPGKPQPSAWTLGYAGFCSFRSFNDNTS